MDDPQDWDLDTEHDRPETCSKDLKKYFYLVGGIAVAILASTFLYAQYSGKSQFFSKGMTPFAAGPGPAGAAPMAVNWFPGAPAAAPAGRWMTKAAKGGFSSIAMSLRNSVVNISTTSTGGTVRGVTAAQPETVRFANPFSGRTNGSIGSGIIVRNDGYIVTNHHIVRGAGSATVTVFNNQGTERYRANVIKLDEVLDLALLKIQPRMSLSAVVLGDSDRVRVADEVIAIGSPFGLDQTVSRGIVSALRKSLAIEGITHANLIQTDAAINQGNSGGPLIATNGSVIGINTAIYTPTGAFSGISFSIPSNQVKEFIKDEFMIQAANPMAAVRGIFTANPAPAAATPGAVGNAGPAIAVGVFSPHSDGRENMVCESCHQVISGYGGLGQQGVGQQGLGGAAAYRFAEPPTTLAMNVAGGGVPRAANGAGFAVMGAMLLPIDAGLAERLGHPSGKGVFVSNVVAGSPAAVAGLKPGDIILKAEGQRVWAPGQMADILMPLENGETARFGVSRDGVRLGLDITVAALP
ncbi:MAG: trypsin-like peptidase domain-containing protein, partial [Rhodospirillales bacterium]